MTRLCGRARKGKRPLAPVPHGHWKTTTFVAGLRHHRITAPLVIDCPMNGHIFETYVKKCLAPTLSPGDIVVRGIGRDAKVNQLVRIIDEPQIFFRRPGK